MLNGYAVNGVVLGNGSPSKNSYVSALCTAVASTAITVYKQAMLSFNVVAKASSVSRFNSIQAFAASVMAVATSSVTFASSHAQYLVASVAAVASANGLLGILQSADAAVTAFAFLAGQLVAWRPARASVVARAISTINVLVYTGNAPTERTAIVPSDVRVMRLPA